MSWSFEDGDNAFKDLKQLGHADEFWQLKPELTERQEVLLNAFLLARKDHDVNKPIPTPVLKEHTAVIAYEQDWAIWILRRLDDYYSELRSEKMEVERERAKQNGR